MNIITVYPLWLILLIAAFSLLVTWILYFYKKNKDIGNKVILLLGILRFCFVFFLSALLLSPLVLIRVKNIEKPLVIFAQDNSKSILYSSDSAYYKGEYLSKVKSLSNQLSEKFDFRFILFSNDVRKSKDISYHGDETDLSYLLQNVKTTFSGRNVGALILASDGIYNKGGNPITLAEDIPFPIYSVLMGDSAQKTDLAIRNVDYNKTTFYKNTFPVEIQLNAFNLQQKKSTLTISLENQILFSKIIDITNKKFSETVRFFVDASQKGLQRYRIALSPIEGEYTTKNNQYDIFINVLDTREKILITYHSPHPDISAIKQALISSDMYQVDVKQVNEIDKNISDYKIIFAHQLPNIENNAANLFATAKQWSIPIVMLLASKSSLAQFNQMNTGLQIAQKNNMWNDAFPSLNSNFVLFTLNSGFKEYINNLPPIQVPFGNFSTSPSASVFLYQRIGNFVSTMPMVIFNDQLGYRNCVIAGEGIWKWRLSCFQYYNHFHFFDELIHKIPQYLVTKNDNSNFRVKMKQLFSQNESITATAELYNQSNQLDNSPEVFFVITDKQGKEYPYTFSRENRSYGLSLGLLPVGEYRWTASTKLGDLTYSKTGAFIVQNVNTEALNITADFSLLITMAKFKNGKGILARNVETISTEIENNSNIKPVSFYSKTYNELSSSWIYWIFLIVIGVAEWFIRKYNGLS